MNANFLTFLINSSLRKGISTKLSVFYMIDGSSMQAIMKLPRRFQDEK